jgi:hypothetical protein
MCLHLLLSELRASIPRSLELRSDFSELLINCSGFPEPFVVRAVVCQPRRLLPLIRILPPIAEI